jgi:phage-related protein
MRHERWRLGTEDTSNDGGNTYRAVYTVKLAGVIYVLHAFQKKSKRGAKTPAEEIEKVKTRLKEAEKHHAEWSEKQKGEDQEHH